MTLYLKAGKKPKNKWAKRYRPKRTLRKNKSLGFHTLKYWTTDLDCYKIALVPILKESEVFVMYKHRNKFSILHKSSSTDIYLYPRRLYSFSKKLIDKRNVEWFWERLIAEFTCEEIVTPQGLLGFIRDTMTIKDKEIKDK